MAVIAWTIASCGGSSGDDARVDEGTDDGPVLDIPTFAEVTDVELDDERADLLGVLGVPEAFRIAFVPVEGTVVRRETWDYLSLEARIDLVDGRIVLTSDLEPVADGAWYPVHVDPTDFRDGMSPDDVRAQLAGVELRDVDLSEATGAGGTALVGGQLLVTFSDGEIVTVETFPLVPDPDGLQQDLIEAVTP